MFNGSVIKKWAQFGNKAKYLLPGLLFRCLTHWKNFEEQARLARSEKWLRKGQLASQSAALSYFEVYRWFLHHWPCQNVYLLGPQTQRGQNPVENWEFHLSICLSICLCPSICWSPLSEISPQKALSALQSTLSDLRTPLFYKTFSFGALPGFKAAFSSLRSALPHPITALSGFIQPSQVTRPLCFTEI